MAAKHKWAVRLDGEAFDLEDARELFGGGTEFHVCEIEVPGDLSPTVLMANEFDGLQNSTEVLDAAQRIVSLLNGILFVLDTGRKPLRVGAVRKRNDDGSWGSEMLHATMHAMGGRSRLKAHGAVLSTPGHPPSPPPPPPPPPPHEQWLREANTNDTLMDVLTYLRGEPDWFDLYKAFERMRDEINRKLGQHQEHKIGWPDTAEVRRSIDIRGLRISAMT
jgi:hypothetical protein